MPKPSSFLTVPVIASELGVTEVTVRTWIREGRLPAIKAGRAYRVRREDLDRMTSFNRASETPQRSGPVSLEDEPLGSRVVLPDER
jgi:excisionase family DNA binding protein